MSDLTSRTDPTALPPEVRERLRELERSNADLARLAAVASHDLAEPLRTVSGFLELLQRRHGAALPDQGRELLGHAQDGVVRAQRRIEGLLALARVDGALLERQAVDLDGVVDAVLVDLGEQVQATGAQVVRPAPLGTVLGDERLIGQLLQNLLSNAMKFTADGKAPTVELGSAPAVMADGAPAVEVWVKDGGIGFDPEDADRVFRSYARLRDDYAGSGIGLAVCRRIVARHEGRIWVDSEPGDGSRFAFTLRAV